MKSVLTALGNFLFGKDPDIFDEKGTVSHKLPRKKWDDWHNRTKLDSQNNWRNHAGIQGKQTPKAPTSEPS